MYTLEVFIHEQSSATRSFLSINETLIILLCIFYRNVSHYDNCIRRFTLLPNFAFASLSKVILLSSIIEPFYKIYLNLKCLSFSKYKPLTIDP